MVFTSEPIDKIEGEVALDTYVKAQTSAPEVVKRITELENCLQRLACAVLTSSDVDRPPELRAAAEEAKLVLKNRLEVDDTKHRFHSELGGQPHIGAIKSDTNYEGRWCKHHLSLLPYFLTPYLVTCQHASRALATLPAMARQRLGQHFLADLDWREQVARAIRVSPHSTAPLPGDEQHCWIEIGSGHGEITRHLLAPGGPVYAIELDASLVAGLRRLAKDFPNLTVVPGDILKTDLAAIAARRRVRLYGNLPYYITSPILHHLFQFVDLIDEMHFVIQAEVARRLAAPPGTREYGYLSVITQFYTRPEFVFEIPHGAFHPRPEVTSALVTLRLPGERAKLSPAGKFSSTMDAHAQASRAAESRFLDFAKLCFAQKRKTLVNNLRSLAKPEEIRGALASQSLRPDARAEQLAVSQLAALFSQLPGG